MCHGQQKLTGGLDPDTGGRFQPPAGDRPLRLLEEPAAVFNVAGRYVEICGCYVKIRGCYVNI